MNLKGQTIFITGGTSGVGLALTEALYKDNQVIICARNKDTLIELAKRLKGVKVIQADLSKEEDLDKLIEILSSDFPDLSVLINNAGVQFNYSFLNSEPKARVTSELAINLTAPLLLSAGLLPILKNQKQASIVNVTSGLALAPKKSAAVYSASKAALRTFGQALRYQLEDEAPHVNLTEAILPMVDTAMTHGRGRSRMKLSPEQVAKEIIQAVQANKKEARVGPVKAFMVLNQIAPFITKRIFRNS